MHGPYVFLPAPRLESHIGKDLVCFTCDCSGRFDLVLAEDSPVGAFALERVPLWVANEQDG